MKDILKRVATITTTASFALVPNLAMLEMGAEAETHVGEEGEIRILLQETADVIENEARVEEDVDLTVEAEVANEEAVEDTPNEETGAFVLIRTDLLENEEETDPEAEATDPKSVETGADLEAYARTILLSDENAKSVEITSEDVQLTYRTRAKLLGFIPVLVDATATLDAEGTVTVTYPWYAFLSSTNKAEIENDITANLEMSEATGETDTLFTAKDRATILSGMHSILQANFESSTDVEVEEGAVTEIEIEG